MNKKIIRSLFIVTAPIMLLIACSSGKKPSKTVEQFLKAVNEKDFVAARELSTPETGKLIDLMEQLQKLSGATDSIAPVAFEITGEKIEADGKSAIVEFREKGGEQTEQIRLKMVDGSWKVDFSKQDLARKDGGFGEEGDSGTLESDSLPTLESPEDSAAVTPLP